jgi:hypothetical protein
MADIGLAVEVSTVVVLQQVNSSTILDRMSWLYGGNQL